MILNPYIIDIPQPIAKQFVSDDYVGDPYCCAKFGANLSTEAFDKLVKYRLTNFFIYTFLGIHLQIKMLDGFLPRDAMLARYAVVVSVCMCVTL